MTEEYDQAKKLIDLSGDDSFTEARLKEKMGEILKLPGNNECVECSQEGLNENNKLYVM
jgi:hypothetical protein